MIVVDQLHLEHTKITLELLEEFDNINDTHYWHCEHQPWTGGGNTRGNKNNPSRQCTLIFGFWEIMSDDLNWEINTAEISPMNSPRHSW